MHYLLRREPFSNSFTRDSKRSQLEKEGKMENTEERGKRGERELRRWKWEGERCYLNG